MNLCRLIQALAMVLARLLGVSFGGAEVLESSPVSAPAFAHNCGELFRSEISCAGKDKINQDGSQGDDKCSGNESDSLSTQRVGEGFLQQIDSGAKEDNRKEAFRASESARLGRPEPAKHSWRAAGRDDI